MEESGCGLAPGECLAFLTEVAGTRPEPPGEPEQVGGIVCRVLAALQLERMEKGRRKLQEGP